MKLMCKEKVLSGLFVGEIQEDFTPKVTYEMKRSESDIQALNNRGQWVLVWAKGESIFGKWFDNHFEILE